MTQFIELDFTEYSLDRNLLKIEPSGTNVCMCCLDRGGPLVNMRSCRHTEFLRGICNIAVDLLEYSVCQICHRMLAKIHLFKEIVLESQRKLNAQAENLTPNKKLNNLIVTTPTSSIIDITATNIKVEMNLLSKSQIKTELDDENSFDVSGNEHRFKIEFNTNEVLNEIPLKELDGETSFDIFGNVDGFKNEYKRNEIVNKSPFKVKKESPVKLKKSKKEVKKNRVNSSRKKKNKSTMPKSFEDKYAGKITIIQFNKETVMEELDRDRAREQYQQALFKCEECVKSFEYENSLVEHRETKHIYTMGSLQCEICKCYFDNEGSLRKHQLCHFKRYECVKCGKRYRTQPAIIDHYNECDRDSMDKPDGPGRVCPECGLADFKTNRAYRYHVEKHSTGNLRCPHCSKVLANKNGLKTHLLTIHMTSPHEYTYECKPCNKTYKTKMGLHQHNRIHHVPCTTVDKPEYCATCDITFKNMTTLKYHLKWHSNHVTEDAKKYICAHCGEKFLRKPELIEHVQWKHLKSTEHYCKLCDKAYKNDKILRRHNAFVHEKKTLPKNKICDHCGRGFSTSGMLKSHMRTHTGERPLRCAHCAATFAHSGALYMHRKLVHKVTKHTT